MSEMPVNAKAESGGRQTSGRSAELASARCLMYALYSDVLASPFDAEPVIAHQEIAFEELALPYELTNLSALISEWRAADRKMLRSQYSSLFEVGSDGPPVSIREDLHRDQPAGLREDIVRFYDYFGYGLQESFAWAPDHLSVELEFMHFLTFKESEELESGRPEADALSFQLAQSDFAERHLCNWVPELAERVYELHPDALYGRIVASLSEFLVKDFGWQAGTIVARSE